MEQHEEFFELAEDEFSKEQGDEPIFHQRNFERTSETSLTTGDGGSNTDCGLRRRIFSISIESPSEDSIRGFSNRGQDSVKSGQHGSISRRILSPEIPRRDQPLKLKRKKKTRRSLLSDRMQKVDHNKRVLAKLERKYYKSWRTGDEFRVPQVDAYPIFVLRDLIMYSIFLTIACLIAFGSRTMAYNYYPESLTKLIISSKFNTTIGATITFEHIQFTTDMWEFIEKVLCRALYDPEFTEMENTLFGAPQLRQLRVRAGTCHSAPMFHSLYVTCVDYYSEDIESKTDFGLGTTAWKYVPADEDQSYFDGKISTYPGGGFILNFTNDENFTMNDIAELRDNNWVRFGTRAVLVDFALFNRHTHLFCVCKLIFEFPPFGGIIPNYVFTTFEVLNYEKPWDFFILSCEIIFLCYTCYYSYEEIAQIYRLRWHYLNNWWNFLDVIIVFCAYLVIILGMSAKLRTENFVKRHVGNIHTQNHVSFDRIVSIQSQYESMVVIVMFNMWLKIFKFTTATRTVSLILAAIIRAGWSMTVVTIMMFSILIGYAIMGFIVFGSLFQSFATFGISFFTVIRLLTGGFHFNLHDETHGGESSGVLWLATITFFVFRLTFLNFYVALIVCGFDDEESECNQISDTASIGDVIREAFCKFLLAIGQDRTALMIDEWEVARQNIRIYDTLVKILRRHGFESVEIDLLMTYHKVTYGYAIRERTMIALYQDMHVRNKLSLEVKDHFKIEEHVEQIEEIIELIDQTLMDIMVKVDHLTDRFIKERTTSPTK